MEAETQHRYRMIRFSHIYIHSELFDYATTNIRHLNIEQFYSNGNCRQVKVIRGVPGAHRPNHVTDDDLTM